MPTGAALLSASAAVRRALAHSLAAEMKRLHITAAELARRAGLGEQTTCDLLAGRTMPGLDAVVAIERGLGHQPGWITRQLASSLTRSG